MADVASPALNEGWRREHGSGRLGLMPARLALREGSETDHILHHRQTAKGLEEPWSRPRTYY